VQGGKDGEARAAWCSGSSQAHHGVAKRAAEPSKATARTDRGDHAQGDSKRCLHACMKFKAPKTPKR
jgi:hypothetical protein